MARKGKGKGGKIPGSRKGFPSWVKPTVSMLIGGGVGLLAVGVLPAAVAPYGPALGVLGSKFLGGGSWSKYAVAASAVAGVTFLSRRPTVQLAAGSLRAAMNSLQSGGSSVVAGPAEITSGSAAEAGEKILQQNGLR